LSQNRHNLKTLRLV